MVLTGNRCYCFKHNRTGKLVGRIFTKRPSAAQNSYQYENCTLVDCIITEVKKDD